MVTNMPELNAGIRRIEVDVGELSNEGGVILQANPEWQEQPTGFQVAPVAAQLCPRFAV